LRNVCVNRQETSSIPLDWLHFARGNAQDGVTYWNEASEGENVRWLVCQKADARATGEPSAHHRGAIYHPSDKW